jgi:hypothetical protein
MHDAPVAHNHEGGAGRAGAPQLGLLITADDAFGNTHDSISIVG